MSLFVDEYDGHELAGAKAQHRLKELGILLLGAIIFAFLVDLLSNFIADYITAGTFPVIPILVAGFLVVIPVYLLYYDFLVLRSRAMKRMELLIIYDISEGMVIDDQL